ncbi:sterol desaturase family protein [Pseudomonas sp. TH41]|uniref:sterol desaturase family protein n=1 Tax=Pseudomonas sp. TH41 TaxID=2796405 RepID=UPI0019128E08|nr:sterol desaturase family protein [Pseudomonas sp. TH41]MBK5351433.1 sterol desaturase family protein [Pseudomonas sp. TH41]
MGMTIGLSVFVTLFVLDIVMGEFRKPGALSMNELGVNLISIVIAFSIRALPFAGITYLLVTFLPEWRNALAHTHFAVLFLAVLLLDDYGNYWFHRQAHQIPWLWRLHKPHHIPTRMNVLMGVRESTFYYLLIPVNVMAPLLVFVGAEEAGAAMLGLKLTVGYLQHVGYRWDLWLRRFAPGRLFLDLAENLFSLQDFHHVHHGIGRYGNASSNYGNVLNIWDKIHNTSSGHPHCAQDAYGVPTGAKVESWAVQLFWPLCRERKVKPDASSIIVQSSPDELEAAQAIIFTAEGLAIAVR